MTVTDTLTVPAPPASTADWNDAGVVIVQDAFDVAGDLAAYVREWIAAHGYRGKDRTGRISADRPGGWGDATPYVRHGALRALCCDGRLAGLLEGLLGEPAGVHLNLTGWVTTERDWHQDSYLNPPHVGDKYAAIWLALDTIDADSGPFQYVPGSHRWPQVTQERIGRYYDLSDPLWPKRSERMLTPLFKRMLVAHDAEVVSYVPKAGDLLVWHGRLLHRGSKARTFHMERRALIAHYSGIHHREDMPAAVQHDRGGWYFPLGGTQPVR